MTLQELTSAFSDEWILLGNPEWNADKTEVLSGTPLYHSKDKREVCYLGRDKTDGYAKVTFIFTGAVRAARAMTGIFNRVSPQ